MKKLMSIVLASIFVFSMMSTVVLADLADDISNDPYIDTMNLSEEDPKVALTNIVNSLLAFLGILAVAVVLVGGFKWMTSGGSEEKVTSARQMIVAGIIGLAIVLAAFAIVKFVVDAVV